MGRKIMKVLLAIVALGVAGPALSFDKSDPKYQACLRAAKPVADYCAALCPNKKDKDAVAECLQFCLRAAEEEIKACMRGAAK